MSWLHHGEVYLPTAFNFGMARHGPPMQALAMRGIACHGAIMGRKTSPQFYSIWRGEAGRDTVR